MNAQMNFVDVLPEEVVRGHGYHLRNGDPNKKWTAVRVNTDGTVLLSIGRTRKQFRTVSPDQLVHLSGRGRQIQQRRAAQ